MVLRRLAVLVMGLMFGGCAAVGGSTTSGAAWVHPQFPYAVTYRDERAKAVLGDDWRLENYRVKESAEGRDVELEPGYVTTYKLDFNDDGATDADVSLPQPDLLLVNTKTGARIEVSTLLVDRDLSRKQLSVLLKRLVESPRNARSLFAGSKRDSGAPGGDGKKRAARLIDAREASLGGQRGLVATIDRTELDPAPSGPVSSAARSRLFLLRAPFDFFYEDPRVAFAAPNENRSLGVLLLVEYLSTPDGFEADYPAFLSLMSQLHVLGDQQVLDYLAAPLARCTRGTKRASLTIEISGFGRGAIHEQRGLDERCAESVVATYRFAATGERREVRRDYDFEKSLAPAWLTEASYREVRPKAETAPGTPATPTPPPAAAPAPADPTPAPADPTPAPADPTPAPAADPTPAPAPAADPTPAPAPTPPSAVEPVAPPSDAKPLEDAPAPGNPKAAPGSDQR